MNFQGQHIVILGGSSGIGKEIARQVIRRGATAHVIGRSRERLTQCADELGREATTHQADIANEADVKRVFGEIPRIDHLVTTAADLTFKPFLDLTDSDIAKMLGSKFWGPIYAVRHAARQMARDGSITFFSGVAAYKGSPGASIVAMLNAGLEGFMRTLAVELSPIRINVVSPGIVDTPIWDQMSQETKTTYFNEVARSLPVKRVGTPEDLAQAALSLMENGFISATVFHVDGGARV